MIQRRVRFEPKTRRDEPRPSGLLPQRILQGLNILVSIYERGQQPDDSVGGSVRTDALRYANVRARLSNGKPSRLLVEQGFEVRYIHELIIYPDAYPAIQEEDIVIPQTGRWAGARLKVISHQPSSLRPGEPRAHVQLFCIRDRYANETTEEAPIT